MASPLDPPDASHQGPGSLHRWTRGASGAAWSPAPLAVAERRQRALRGDASPPPAPPPPSFQAEGRLPRAALLAWLRGPAPGPVIPPPPTDRGPGGSWWAWATGGEDADPIQPSLRLHPQALAPARAPGPRVSPSAAPEDAPSSASPGLPILQAALLRGWVAEEDRALRPPLLAPLGDARRALEAAWLLTLPEGDARLALCALTWLTRPAPPAPRPSPWTRSRPDPDACRSGAAAASLPEAPTPAPGPLPLGAPPQEAPLAGALGPLRPRPGPQPGARGNPIEVEGELDFEDRTPFSLPRREPALGRFQLRMRGATLASVHGEAQGAIALTPRRAPRGDALPEVPITARRSPGLDAPPGPPLLPEGLPIPPAPRGIFAALGHGEPATPPFALARGDAALDALAARLASAPADPDPGEDAPQRRVSAAASPGLDGALARVRRWLDPGADAPAPLPWGPVAEALQVDLMPLGHPFEEEGL